MRIKKFKEARKFILKELDNKGNLVGYAQGMKQRQYDTEAQRYWEFSFLARTF